MAWPVLGPVRGCPAPRLPGWAIGAWGRAVSIPPGSAAGWRSGSTGCSRTTAMKTGGSPGRSPPGGAPVARPDRSLADLPRPVGRSARAIPGPLPRRCPPPRGGAIPSRAVPGPRSAAAWRRSPVAHRRWAHPNPLPSPQPPRGTPPGPPPRGLRPGPMTMPSPCSVGNACLPPPGSRWPSLRRRQRLLRAGPCPAPPGAVRRRAGTSRSAGSCPPAGPYVLVCSPYGAGVRRRRR